MSGICAFFGHRDTNITYELERKFEETVLALIDEGIDEFWCCEQGNFDWLSRMVMLRIKKNNPFIYLCYIPASDMRKFSKVRQKYLDENFEILYADEMEAPHPRLSIVYRNNYIAKNADVIVCYVTTNSGGAYKAVEIARKNEKKVINLAGMYDA